MSLDDYAVSYNVGFCWALRLSQVLAFTECPIDSQAEESLKKFMHQRRYIQVTDCYNELGICFTGVLFLKNKKYQCCQKNCNVPVPILLFLLFAMFLKNMLCCT